MTMSNDINVSPWNVPPIDHSTPLGASKSGYHSQSQSVSAPKPNRPVTETVDARPASIEAFTWVSTHGGAGSTSLRRGSGRGLDLTARWPDPARGWPSSVALVCRSNSAGLDAMGQMLQEWVSRSVPGVHVMAAVVVADGPTKPPKRIRARVSELRSITPTVITMPWVEEWRELPYGPHQTAVQVADAVGTAQTQVL